MKEPKIIEKHFNLGHQAFGRVYFYTDESNVYYLENLRVSEEHQGKGYGNILLDVLEKYCIHNCYETTKIRLFAEKGKWMYDWYLRKGYVYLCDYEDDNKFDWLEKIIDNKNN